jgi:hypothetical protein
MSKTQEKRARRLAEQQAFIKARRQQELVLLEMQFQRGLELYEANKDKMSEEEIEIMEREKQKFLDTLAEFKKENGLGEEEKTSN